MAETAQVACQVCGKPIWFVTTGDGTTGVAHLGCERPTWTMRSEHPRTFGVITGVSD